MKKELKKLRYLSLFMATYCVFTVVQNLFEMKTLGTTEFAFGGGGVILSWATFMIMDICTELFGKKDTMTVYTFAGILNLVIVCLAQIVIKIPGTYPEQNMAFELIFSNGIRTALASFIAFWVGNFVNMNIMIDMKSRTPQSDLWFFVRAVASTIVGQFVDNIVFATLAFAPVGISVFEMRWIDIITSVLFGTCVETIIESCFVPFITIPVSKKIEKLIDE